MANKLEKVTGTLWQEITKNVKQYAVSDLKEKIDGPFPLILQDARDRASGSGEPVEIAAYYKGKWYLIDIAYPEGLSE